MKTKVETDGDSETNLSLSKPQFDNMMRYAALGFTVILEEERPLWLLCLKKLAADNVKPN